MSAGPRPRLVVVGPPGSGKTTIGRAVAQSLGEPFVDVDEVVEQREGRSISDIFVDDGEPAFRELEREVCAQLLANGSGVVALGGGSVLDPRTEADLQGLHVVFLVVGIADAAKRVGFAQSRPLLMVNPRAAWTQLMNARRPVYERVATFAVDTAGRSVDEVVTDVVTALKEREQA
ncbi:shikimate kinase [Angustibacter sp. Root456]|uniref:shikimate kinase n=1 Tax=Angustibacter sp. Root456 TaxID=1736539 RepID=UPI0006FD032B|nr:shikimate kinase [Angustibacter sp. Root456]KQX66710.1 shikimate kinase [Angustibacter sp. Root456]